MSSPSTLHPRSTVAAVTAAQQFAYPFQYVKDQHFRPLFNAMSHGDAIALADVLDADSREEHADDNATCPKARAIRREVADHLARPDFLSLSRRLAAIRRTCCWCHETGSFARG